MRQPTGLLRYLCLGAALASLGTACRHAPATKSYQLHGQVLAVHPDKQQVTIRHEDVAGYMPGMTMSFPVTKSELLTGREPGEMVTATLEVSDALGRISAIERTGFQPLPTDSNAAAIPGNLLEPGSEVPDAALIDQDNRRRTMSEWRGSATLLTFIYTRCPLPNFCPLMDRHFAALQRAIASDPSLTGRAKLVSISFDPDHDSPAVLLAHAKGLKADPAVWTFLTGDRVTLDRFAAKFGVGLIRPADTTEITHNLRTMLIGPDGRLVRIYAGNEWVPAKVLEDLRTIVKPPV